MLAILCLAFLSCPTDAPLEHAPLADMRGDLAHAERELRDTLEARYRLTDGIHYAEFADGDRAQPTAYLWSHAVTLSALARGLAVNRRFYQPLWDTARKALDSYWIPGHPGGFSVSPGQIDHPERYYDDNVWLVWAMLDAYQTTHDSVDLEYAQRAYRFAVSGLDDKLGGGIYWQERHKTEKNACINAPAAAVSFLLYTLTKDRTYLATGNELLAWTQRNLQDSDGLIMDNVSLAGKIERTKWTYNTACYIRALLARYRITHSAEDRDEALRLLAAAEKKWIVPETHLLNDPGPFGQHLLDALFEAAEDLHHPGFRETAIATILAVAKSCPDEQRLYGEYWNRKPKEGETRNLRYLGSVLRSVLSAECALQAR